MRLKLRHKYGAVQTKRDGIKFSSKKEAAEYEKLKALKERGEVLFFLRQVPIELPGGITYRIDFLIFWANGECEFREVKGFRTKLGDLKIKQTIDLYNIDINVV